MDEEDDEDEAVVNEVCSGSEVLVEEVDKDPGVGTAE
jgi:hypothetical protein